MTVFTDVHLSLLTSLSSFFHLHLCLSFFHLALSSHVSLSFFFSSGSLFTCLSLFFNSPQSFWCTLCCLLLCCCGGGCACCCGGVVCVSSCPALKYPSVCTVKTFPCVSSKRPCLLSYVRFEGTREFVPLLFISPSSFQLCIDPRMRNSCNVRNRIGQHMHAKPATR